MPAYVQPSVRQRFSQRYLFTTPSGTGSSIAVGNDLIMDMSLPQGGVSFNNILSDNGTGTTNATVGTTTQITHNLGVIPNFIFITETSDGTVYIDTTVAATATTFNVKGSAASLTFNWMVM